MLQKLNKKNAVSLMLFASVVYLTLTPVLGVGTEDLGQIDSPEGFEQNMFIPVMDVWVNQSSASALLSLSAAESWELAHYYYVPDNNLIEWEIIDPTAILVKGFMGKSTSQAIDYVDNSIGLAVDSDPGYEQYTARTTDSKVYCDVSEIMRTTVPKLDLDDTQWGSASLPSQLNYTWAEAPEEYTYSGIHYAAGDGKSTVEYAKDLAVRFGRTYYNVHNASAIGFEYDDPNHLQTVQWGFDEQSSSTLALSTKGQTEDLRPAWTLKRYNFIPKIRTPKIVSSVFSKLGGAANTGLAMIPKGAKSVFKRTIGAAFFPLKMITGGFGTGWTKTVTRWGGILLVVVIIVFALRAGKIFNRIPGLNKINFLVKK